ncbi:hypothetical protein J0A66_20700 [Bowmanella dokdonensis]|uniref:Insecticide toxin TcdB middle/N-terminal domain-containing protein n=1 Tax=Bowmanella dokdonensis TaxID=751969 RepID=A0A939DS41_9ALTE|nr:hypothetical protein [Bowmanella dokdonensis]
MPIVIPPGRAGMQPQVTLSYSSRGGNDIAGVGFSLSAGGSLSRCPPTMDQDEFASGIQYDLSIDKLCLNGQRLIAVSGTYGASGAEYRTELGSMARVIQLGGSINSLSAYFKVHLPNNNIQYYGQSAKVRADGKLVPISWLLDKEINPAGNQIDYSYSNVGAGELLLQQINYTGDANNTGDREVRFAYESRPDVRTQFIAGGKTRQTRRLKTISTWYAGNKIRQYSLVYQSSSASNRSLLISINECGQYGAEICRKPTIFDWSDSQIKVDLQLLTTSSGDELLPTDGEIIPDIRSTGAAGDINGDGVRDWPTYFVNAEGGSDGANSYQSNSCRRSSFLGQQICVNADFDLDGRTDIWWVESGFLKVGLTDFPSQVITPVNTNVSMKWDTFREDRLVHAADYNGDGWPDLVVETKLKSGSGSITSGRVGLYLHSTNPYYPYPSEQEMVNIGPDEDLQYLGDMDGNGLPDLAVARQDPHESTATLKRLLLTHIDGSLPTFVEKDLNFGGFGQFGDFSMLLDVNGDGLPDWLGWMANGLSEDDGGGGEIPRPPPGDIMSGDTNAEKLTAEYEAYEQQLAENNGYLMVKLNNGNGEFSAPIDLGAAATLPKRTVQTPISTPQEPDYKVLPKFSTAFKVADLNGDGVDELLFPGDGQILASGCIDFRYYPIGSGGDWEWTTRCGAQHYGTYFREDGTRAAMSTDWDTNVYRYKAMHFIELSDGSIKAQIEQTDMIGTANNSFLMDGFGKGLPDLVFAYGCKTPTGCSVTPISGSPMAGKTLNKVYISRNLGSSELAAPGNDDYQAIDMLVQVQDGAGKVSQWSYHPLTTGQIPNYYQMPRDVVDSEHFNFASSMYAVSRFEQSNGVGSTNKYRYHYTDATYNFKGRGFRGFTGITVFDDVNNTQTETAFRVKFPFTSQITSQKVFRQGDPNPIRELNNIWYANTGHNSRWPGTFAIYNHKAEEIRYDVQTSGSATTVTTTPISTRTVTVQGGDVDDFGNVLIQTEVIDDTTMTLTKVVETDFSLASETWPRRWENKTLTSSPVVYKGAQPSPASSTNVQKVTTTAVTWNSTFRLPDTQTTTGDGSSLLTTYVYNNYGLPKKLTRSGTAYSGSAMTAATQNRVTEIYYSNNGNTVAEDGYFPYQTNTQVGNGKLLSTYQKTDPALGQPTEQTDISNVVTTTKYDQLGRPKQVDVTGQPTQYISYQTATTNGAVMKVVSQQAGAPKAEEYKDLLGRTVHTRVEGFNSSTWIKQDISYDARGLKTYETNPYTSTVKGVTTYSGHDVLGRVTQKVTNGTYADLTTQYSYSGLTTNISTTAEVGSDLDMSRTYNSLEQLVETIDANGMATQYLYDAGGNPILIQDVKDNRITAKYDALGRKAWVNDPNQGQTQFTYNDFGELEKELDANSKAIFYDMDHLGRVTQRIADGSTATFAWDANSGINVTCKNGLLCRESENGITKVISYNWAGQPTHTTLTVDGNTYITETQYDGNYGRPKAMNYPNGLQVAYDYNARGYLTREYNAASNYTYREVTAQDAFGNITAALIGDGNETGTYNYSAKTGQMLSSEVISNGITVQSLVYSSYDSYGNLLTQHNQAEGINSTDNFVYDELQRLVSAATTGSGFDFSVDYGYDAAGNIQYKTDYSTNSASAYQYVSGSNKLSQVALKAGGSVSFGYDNKGNLTHRNGSQEITYNIFNKPVSISRNGSVNFTYGADLARAKQVRTVSGQTTTTYYIGKHYEVDVTATATINKLYISDVAVLELGNSDKKIRFTHRDRLGSATTFTDHNGALVSRRHFDPFGTPRGGDWTQLSTPRLNDGEMRRGFTDHEHLDEAELIHMNGRVYDYKVGRFLSVDPVIQSPGNSQSINPYSYIMNNPMSGTDPTGYSGKPPESCAASRLGSICDKLPPSNGGNGSNLAASNTAKMLNSKHGGGESNGASASQPLTGSDVKETMDMLGEYQKAKQGGGSGLQASFNDKQLGNIADLFKGGNYAGAYSYILGEIQGLNGVDDVTKFWFEKAIEINLNKDTPANTWIRAFTTKGLALDGIIATPEMLQGISDSIAQNVITDVLRSGGVPNFNQLVVADIRVALSNGGQTIGGWGGSSYFWDLPYGPNNETVGQLIRGSSYELNKFRQSYSHAMKTTFRQHGMNAAFDAVKAGRTLGFGNAVKADLACGTCLIEY